MADRSERPNVIIMYADDIGFGDVGCYGGTGIPTPHVDRLANEGIRFQQGYATAATCTPSRYSLLTGSYPWRNERAAILAGDAPLIIPPGTQTLPSVFKKAGYHTAIVGKWHLGLGEGNLDWNEAIARTPLDLGFDRSFIMAATNDRVPCVYVDGRRVFNLDPEDPIDVSYGARNPFPEVPTGRDNPELLTMHPSHGHDMTIVNGVSRIGYMRGGRAALWKDDEMAEVFLERATSFVREHREEPFFLYYALHQPHVPRIPGKRFVGATKLGPRGDVIAEMDWCIGQILETLDELGLAENTIVIFSSDNGPVLDDGYQDRAIELCGDHRPTGPLRGGKYSMYDGGTRVPFVLRWSGTVPPGESAAIVSHADFYASFASLLGVPLQAGAAPDSFDVLAALLGESSRGRDELVTEGTQGKTVLRQGDWTFIPPHEGPAVSNTTHIELGNAPVPQLYDLSMDIGQIRNLAQEESARVAAMSARLQEIRQGERTRPLNPA
ncbi:MAG: sulfatase family protein [Anaerolineae bacterium]